MSMPIAEPYPVAIINFLRANNMSVTQFANKIGYHPFTVLGWLTSYRVPTIKTALKIAKVTANRIPFDDFKKTSRVKYVFICPYCCEDLSKVFNYNVNYFKKEYCNSFIRSSSRISIPCWKCGELSNNFRLSSSVTWEQVKSI